MDGTTVRGRSLKLLRTAQPSKAQRNLDETLSLSHKDFARLLTEG